MVEVGDQFELVLWENLFIHEEQMEFSYGATLKNNEDLPHWLEFDRNELTLEGTPSSGEQGTYEIYIKGTTEITNEIIETKFELKVLNNPPEAVGQDRVIAGVGEVFRHEIIEF